MKKKEIGKKIQEFFERGNGRLVKKHSVWNAEYLRDLGNLLARCKVLHSKLSNQKPQ